MDDDEFDAGQFQPIAQMRRLAMVLPKALETIDPIPVKLWLPESLDPDLWPELPSEQLDLPPRHKSVNEVKDFLGITTRKDGDEHEKQEIKKKESEKQETGKKEPQMIITEMKEAENKESEKKEDEIKEKEKHKTESKDYEKKESEKRKNIPKNGKESIILKETSGKQNFWSESETSSVTSIASQLSLRPGRNMRATPMSRTSSRNTYSVDLPVEMDPNEAFSPREMNVSSTADNNHSFQHAKKRVRNKNKDLMDQLVEGRKREHRREIQRYYVRSMINDTFRRKRNGNSFSSGIDHPSAKRGLPVEPRSQSNLSQLSIRGSRVGDQPKHHHHHHSPPSHYSKRSASASKPHRRQRGSEDTSEKSSISVRSLKLGQRIHSAEPLTSSAKGADEAENIIRIIREEFERLRFL